MTGTDDLQKNTPKRGFVKLAIDLGGSQTKIVAAKFKSGVQEKWQAFYVDPEVIEITQFSVDKLKQNNFLQEGNPTQGTWIGINGQYYALGALAVNQFNGFRSVKPLKNEIAPLKILAALWMIKAMWNLDAMSNRVEIYCLLPANEYNPEIIKVLNEKLKAYLQGFETPSGVMKLKLSVFKCIPEAAGILTHYCYNKGQQWQERTKVGIWMLGYRNTSLLVSNEGAISLGETSNLGFVTLVDRVTGNYPGLTREQLSPILGKAGGNLDVRELDKLFNGVSPEEQRQKTTKLQKIILECTKEYLILLRSWLNEYLQNNPLDLLLVVGGTADYLSPFLDSILENYPWERPEPSLLDPKLENILTPNRLADVWSLSMMYMDLTP